MNELVGLADCRVWHIDAFLAKLAIAAPMIEGREDSGSELALVVQAGALCVWKDAAIRGVASLHPEDVAPVIEWCTTDREVIAAFGRALKRLGWPGAPTLASHVYGSAS